ncbi:MAG: glycine cleavage system protein GcvH [Oligoflexia bacterium]|nr:glycine cleavage system protein GcvH [Oligoflexia bacterium]
MQFPSDRKYTKDHEWVLMEGADAVVGITEFAQSELGEIVFADLPAAGKAIKQGDTFCVVESTKAASDVYSPIGGKVKSTNSKLSDSPGLINSSPYKDGWLVRLEAVNKADLEGLMTAEQYKTFLGDKA